MTEKENKIKLALESQWETLWMLVPEAWDAFDEIEEAIAAMTGETTVDVNIRLHKKAKRICREKSIEISEWRGKLLAENAELRAIVDRLPKTADGAPIMPNETHVWTIRNGVAWEVTLAPNVAWIGGHEFYSTRAAAESAVKENDDETL